MIFNRWPQVFLVILGIGICVAILLGTVVTANVTPTLKYGSQEPISLAGQWQFYWGQLLTPADFATSSGTAHQGGTIAVPSSWAGQILGPEPSLPMVFRTAGATIPTGNSGCVIVCHTSCQLLLVCHALQVVRVPQLPLGP